jgi:hypothetical protein
MSLQHFDRCWEIERLGRYSEFRVIVHLNRHILGAGTRQLSVLYKSIGGTGLV